MPSIRLNIPRAWRHRNETRRIHYIEVVQDSAGANGSAERHRYVDDGDPLYAVLEDLLSALGYVGPSVGEANNASLV